MDYGAIASDIRASVNSLNSEEIKSLEFDAIWSGKVHDSLTNNLTLAVSNIEKQKKSANTFADALDKLQKYKDNKEKIESLTTTLNNTADIPENASTRKSLISQINQLTTDNVSLKSSIESLLGTISSVGTEFDVITYDASEGEDYKGYVVDLYDMLKLFTTNSLTKLPDGGSGSSLYDYYSKEQVEAKMNEIKSQYKGRDAAVNCALGIMEMAAAVGKKLDYDWGGGHTAVTSLDQVATGTDCSSFASWAINQGANSTFNTLTTAGLINVGTNVKYENAQKGDILVYNSGGNGHVVMIVDNDPEKQQFLVAEASGSNAGVIMKTRSYSSLTGTYQARDLSSIYNN